MTPRKNYYIITLLATALFLVLSGCHETKKYKIGISQCSQDDWRAKMNDEIEREIMFHEEATVEIRSADDNNEKQIADINYFADNGFDIIIVAPNEAAALTPVIKNVYERGIPVIIFDRNIIGDTYTARIGADDVQLGKSAAHYALSIVDKNPKAIEIYGRRGSTPAEGRHTGFEQEFTANGGKLLASVSANWNQDEAEPIVDSLLRIYDDVDLIYAHNDRMAIGAAIIANGSGRDDIKIVGIDAAPNIGIQAVADGLLDATFLYPTEGHRLVRTALAILEGKPYEREQILPVSSAVDITNADILLLQNDAIKEETNKMKDLKDQIDTYWAQHSSQTSLFYASIAIIVLLFFIVFLLLRAYWQHKRHQIALLEQFRLLEEERDKQKQLNERLQEATQSKLMFFTNVSHDLRTPLTLIAEPVAQVLGAENITPQQRTLMKIADKNIRILHRLINQILDFRKYETGKLELHLAETDLTDAVGEWCASFQTLANRRGMKLSLDMDKDHHIFAAVDVEKMERVFFNLLSNAFKYTPAGGKINVSVKTDDNRFVLAVADTGEGISERDLGNIFDRFYQVDRVHPNGSGIGLTLCKAFVEMHGGSIKAESALKQGSLFTVEIPVKHISDTPEKLKSYMHREEVEAELDTIDTSQTFDSDKPLVLIIDDNKDIQRLITELLQPQYNTIRASNGSDGIKKAAKHVPDLIICDVMMPVMDGLECCKRIKEEVSTSHIPILMLTACSLDEQRVQGYDSGADGYLSKPFKSDVLLARCASLISNRKRIQELYLQTSFIQTKDPAKDSSSATAQAIVTDIDSDFYNRFLGIFNAGMGDPGLNVDALASKLGLERSQFYRKIKSLTNFSPVELIRNLRLKRARQLLTTTEKTVSEIAYETGFSTPAYFSKCYRDAYSETPSETRSRLG